MSEQSIVQSLVVELPDTRYEENKYQVGDLVELELDNGMLRGRGSVTLRRPLGDSGIEIEVDLYEVLPKA